MEKVMLTKEQAEAIETIKQCSDPMDYIVAFSNTIFDKYPALQGVNFDTMARAVYRDYEVEKPKFQPGDKVVIIDEMLEDDDPDANQIFTLKEPRQRVANAWILSETGWEYESDIRHATPEEIYWLETLGREKVNQLKVGDVVAYGNSEPIEIRTPDIWGSLEFTNATGIYPAESFKPFPKEETK